jgi:ABC-type transporter Mla MlaB component
MNEMTPQESANPASAEMPEVAPASAAAKLAPTQVRLEENLTIRHIAGVYAQLKEQINLKQSLTLDLAQVNQIDTSGMQMLLALKRQLAKNTQSLKLVGVTQDNQASIQIAGLADELLA